MPTIKTPQVVHKIGQQVVTINHESVGHAMTERVKAIDHEACAAGDEDPFFVANLDTVYNQHKKWKLHLPRVKPFFGEFSHDACP